MNKAQLVDAVASRADMSKADAGRSVDATLSAIGGALSGGDSVSLDTKHKEQSYWSSS